MRAKREQLGSSRRKFLKQMTWAPMLFLPAPLQGTLARLPLGAFSATRIPHFPFADVGFLPHYPESSPLDALLGFAAPGTDEYIVEGYAAQIMNLLAAWGEELRRGARDVSTLRKCVHPSVEFTSLATEHETSLRSGGGIEVLRREFSSHSMKGLDRFLDEVKQYLKELKSVETADFEIYSCRQTASTPPTVTAEIRYEISGARADDSRESRIGRWRTGWVRDESGRWQ